MSRILDLPSKKLGEWMLKGWVLTDDPCVNEDCPIPLMRSQDGKQKFCVRCDDGPSDSTQKPTKDVVKVDRGDSPSVASQSPLLSRASTPPTDIPSRAQSPIWELPPLSEESIQRRNQSDQASREIGQRMLRGWAMLADECPNDSCFGIPLVRPPPAVHSNKECVICGGVYAGDRDAHGRTILRRLNPSNTPVQTTVAQTPQGNRGGSAEEMPIKTTALRTESTTVEPKPLVLPAVPSSTVQSPSQIVLGPLERSLQALSTRLDYLSMSDPSLLNPVLIGETAAQMTIVLAAWKEAHCMSQST